MNEYSFNLSECQIGCQEEIKLFHPYCLNNLIIFILNSYRKTTKYGMWLIPSGGLFCPNEHVFIMLDTGYSMLDIKKGRCLWVQRFKVSFLFPDCIWNVCLVSVHRCCICACSVGGLWKMVIYVRVQERRKFQPQEYIEYFEDWNLSLTQKSDIKCRFAKVSVDQL